MHTQDVLARLSYAVDQIWRQLSCVVSLFRELGLTFEEMHD